MSLEYLTTNFCIVVIAQWLAWWMAPMEVLGSNSSKEDKY